MADAPDTGPIRNRLVQHLKATIPDEKVAAFIPCPSCGWTKWTVHGIVAQPVLGETTDGKLELSDATLPVVVIACNQCGHTRQFLYSAIGQTPDDGEKSGGGTT